MRTNPLRLMALLIVGTLVTTATRASALEPDAAQACKAFFSAVSAQKYTDAWTLLSATSQHMLAKTLADSTKTSPEASQKLFANADPAVTESFWTPLREHAATLAQGSFTVEKLEGDNALVAIDKVPTAAQPIRFFMVKETSGWKLGLMETVVAAHQMEQQQQKNQPQVAPAPTPSASPSDKNSTDQNQQNQQPKEPPTGGASPKE